MADRLIECVREYPCLWDTKLPSYKVLEVKDAAWREIIKKANIDNINTAKTKWKGLRDTHREKLKKISYATSGPHRKHIKPWKYMELMEFLIPHMFHRDRDTIIVSSPSQDEQTSNHSFTVDSQQNKDVGSSDQDENETEDFDTENTIKRKKNEEYDYNNILKDIKDYHSDRSHQKDEQCLGSQKTIDSLKSFFDSMYESTKKLPDNYQRAIKRTLFSAVMDAEDKVANLLHPGFDPLQFNRRNTVPYTSESPRPSYIPSPLEVAFISESKERNDSRRVQVKSE